MPWRATAALLLAVALVSSACSSADSDAESSAEGDQQDADPADTPADSDDEAEPLPPEVLNAIEGLEFTEVAAEAGLTETHSDLGLFGEQAMTAGASAADVDGDGDTDLFLPRIGKPNGLYINDGSGNFDDVGVAAGVGGPDDGFGASAGSFLDVEGDGDLDLFVTGTAQRGNSLYVNDGTGQFSDEAAERGLAWPAVADAELGSKHHGVSVADVNRDGFLDLLVLQWYSEIYNAEAFDIAAAQNGWPEDYSPGSCETATAFRAADFPKTDGAPATRSALLLNDGNGSFTDVTAQWGLPLEGIVAFTGVFTDFDSDGWQDLAIAGDGCTSRLLRNTEGTGFDDLTFEAGVGTDENGMGAVTSDIDGDGLADLLVTSISYPLEDGEECPVTGFNGCSGNRLYVNNGDFTFRDATDEYGLREGDWGWGAAIEDFDGDGTPEVVQVNGMQTRESTSDGVEFKYADRFVDDATRFWVYADGGYHDVATEIGIDDDAISHGLVTFDMDSDGDLDLLIARANETPLLYRNDGADDGANSILAMDLVDPLTPGNLWGDGARVAVTPVDGGETFVDWVGTSGSYESQGLPTLHMGLGELDGPVERVEVYWPGEAEPQVITGVPTDELLTITRQP